MPKKKTKTKTKKNKNVLTFSFTETLNKPRLEQEPCSAHGRAVNTPRVDH